MKCSPLVMFAVVACSAAGVSAKAPDNSSVSYYYGDYTTPSQVNGNDSMSSPYGISLESPQASAVAVGGTAISTTSLNLSGRAQAGSVGATGDTSTVAQNGEAMVSGGASTYLFGTITAFNQDNITFDSQEAGGQLIDVKAWVKAEGSVNAFALTSDTAGGRGAAANVHIQYSQGLEDTGAGYSSDFYASASQGYYGTADDQHSDPVLKIPVTYTIVPGVKYTLDTQIVLTISSGSQDYGQLIYGPDGSLTPLEAGAANAGATGEFAHTIAWGGVESVTLHSDGTPIDDWTVTSDSGADYSKAIVDVPEPAPAIGMAAMASLSITTLRRRRV